MSSNSIPVTDVSLRGDTITKSRSGDGSFETELEKAEEKINPSSKLLVAPWAEVERAFNFLPLKFDFQLESDQAIQETPKKSSDYQENKPEKQSSQRPAEKTEDLPKIMADLKVLKQVLIKNLPAPQLNLAIVPNNLIPNHLTTPISKLDLQTLIDEIAEKVELLRSTQKTELNMSLFEKDLGELFLSFSLKGGLVSIQIAAGSAESKKALEDNISELEIALKEAKIKLDGIKIVEGINERKFRNPA